MAATDTERKDALKERIRGLVDCGCCPLNEDAVEKVAAFLIIGLGHTDDELTGYTVDNIIDWLYNYDNWTYGSVHTHITKEHDAS